MSFVALGGDGSTRPTFFELVAAERLMPSLKAATIYSLSVSAQCTPMSEQSVCESPQPVSGNHALFVHQRHHTDVLFGSPCCFPQAKRLHALQVPGHQAVP